MKKKKFKIIKLRPKQDYSYKRKVLINDFTLLMSVGIHNFEKIERQEVKFNINIGVKPSLTTIENKINNIVNYETVIKNITKLIKNKHYDLLESLAEDIFCELFKNNNIQKINLKIEKTQIIKNTSSVGVEITKERL